MGDYEVGRSSRVEYTCGCVQRVVSLGLGLAAGWLLTGWLAGCATANVVVVLEIGGSVLSAVVAESGEDLVLERRHAIVKCLLLVREDRGVSTCQQRQRHGGQ